MNYTLKEKGANIMKKLAYTVDKSLCAECSMALRRFVGKMDGVDSVDVEGEQVVINFNEQTIQEDFLKKVSSESLSKLGYRFSE